MELPPRNFNVICRNVFSSIKRYNELRHQVMVLDMTLLSILNDVNIDYWLTTKKILDNNAIFQSYINLFQSIYKSLTMIIHCIRGDDTLIPLSDKLNDQLWDSQNNGHIRRLLSWIDSLKTDITRDEAHDEYCKIDELRMNNFKAINEVVQLIVDDLIKINDTRTKK